MAGGRRSEGRRTGSREPSCVPKSPLPDTPLPATPAKPRGRGDAAAAAEPAAGRWPLWVLLGGAVLAAGAAGVREAAAPGPHDKHAAFAALERTLPDNPQLPLHLLREGDGRATLLHLVCEDAADCAHAAEAYAAVRGAKRHDLTGRESIPEYERLITPAAPCPVVTYNLGGGAADNVFMHHLKALRDGGHGHARTAACATFIYFTVASVQDLSAHGISLKKPIPMRKAMALNPFGGVERIHHVFPSVGVPPRRSRAGP